MVDLEYIEGWLEFQSIESFDAPVDEIEKWIYSNSRADEEQDLNDDEDRDLILDGLENDIENLMIFQNELEGLEVHDEFDDKENSQADYPSKTMGSNKFADIANSSFSNKQKEVGLREVEDDIHSKDLELDENPKPFGHQDKLTGPSFEDTMCISPDLLTETDGKITYYKRITLLPDKTWLPRHSQHHRLKMKILQSKDTKYQYYKNPQCPKSRNGDDIEINSDICGLNLIFHRYSRKLKSSNRIEIMCRLCRGINWVPKRKFNFHMAMSHGILIPYDQTVKSNPIVLPNPKSLFVSKSRKLSDHFVKCPKCESWIKLGFRTDMQKVINKNGLYHNYFVHYLKTHGALEK